MPALTEYQRPSDLTHALALLQRGTPTTVPLAGGTWLVPRLDRQVPAAAVVDLQGLGLDQIDRDPDTLRIGPMATLAAVAADPLCGTLADAILARTARRDAAVNVRHAATVGGTLVVAPADSEFILALLALGAELTVQTERTRIWALAAFLEAPRAALGGGLITQVRIHLPLHAAGGLARVSRTPADHPIVSAAAVISECADLVRIALGGLAPRPLVIECDRPEQGPAAVEQVLSRAAPDTPDDHQGSAEYRRAMGLLLAHRALRAAVANCSKR